MFMSEKSYTIIPNCKGVIESTDGKVISFVPDWWMRLAEKRRQMGIYTESEIKEMPVGRVMNLKMPEMDLDTIATLLGVCVHGGRSEMEQMTGPQFTALRDYIEDQIGKDKPKTPNVSLKPETEEDRWDLI
jgi:hypothetical protein